MNVGVRNNDSHNFEQLYRIKNTHVINCNKGYFLSIAQNLKCAF